MTRAFRRKLMHWYISMLMLLATCTLVYVIYWFNILPSIAPFSQTRLVDIAGPLGEYAIFYAMLFPPLVIWHGFDFVEQQARLSNGSRIFSGYRTLFITMGLAELAILLTTTQLFQYNSCDDMNFDGFRMHFSCEVRPQLWLMAMFIGPLLFSCILCIGKGVTAIRSRLPKAP